MQKCEVEHFRTSVQSVIKIEGQVLLSFLQKSLIDVKGSLHEYDKQASTLNGLLASSCRAM